MTITLTTNGRANLPPIAAALLYDADAFDVHLTHRTATIRIHSGCHEPPLTQQLATGRWILASATEHRPEAPPALSLALTELPPATRFPLTAIVEQLRAQLGTGQEMRVRLT